MIPPEFLGIFVAFGIATATGLNAWIPLSVVSVAAHFGLLSLASPYDIMANGVVTIGLVLIALVEGFADKVPIVDHISHLIHFVLQPAAGAILVATQTSIATDIAPELAFFVGALVAGSVHGVRALAVRPAVTASTVGTGNWIVSLVEDVIAGILTLGYVIWMM